MKAESQTNFVTLTDGRLMQLQPDGSYRPVPSLTDHARLEALTQDEIDAMAPDPDHPPLDDIFWADVDAHAAATPESSVELDEDVISYFRRRGPDVRAEINKVLRRFIKSGDLSARHQG